VENNLDGLERMQALGDSRKVQCTPTGTFFVCLPRAWANQNSLKKGTLLNIEETQDGKLIVDPKYSVEVQPRISTLSVGPFLGRQIIGQYLLGYDIIRIETKDKIDADIRNTVKTTVSSLIGLEIVEETYSQIVLQCLLEPSGFMPEKILRRIYAIVAGMTRDVTCSFAVGDLQLAKNVVARDNESNRLYFLIVRILRTVIQNPRLSEKLGISPIDCLDYRLAASLIEGMGDDCVKIAAKTLELNGAKLPIEIQKLLTDFQVVCYSAHEQALKSFVSKDISSAETVRGLQIKLEAIGTEVEKAAKELSVDLMPQILAVLSFLRQIYEHSVDIADLVV
jgi:phosphate uptake regulator